MPLQKKKISRKIKTVTASNCAPDKYAAFFLEETMTKSNIHVNFEKSLGELETIINRLEAGQISLEESLAAFEQGVNLARHCQEALKTAEQKVQILIEKNGVLSTEPFVVEE